jgi:hypothetical protein
MDVKASHIFKYAWGDYAPSVIKYGVDDPRNCLLLSGPVDVLFDVGEIVFLPVNDEGVLSGYQIKVLVTEDRRHMTLLDHYAKTVSCYNRNFDKNAYLRAVQDVNDNKVLVAEKLNMKILDLEHVGLEYPITAPPSARALYFHACRNLLDHDYSVNQTRDLWCSHEAPASDTNSETNRILDWLMNTGQSNKQSVTSRSFTQE